RCAVTWTTNAWPGGFVSEARFTTADPLSGWTLTFLLPDGASISNAWSADVSQSGQSVTVRNAAWNGNLAARGTVSFGFQGTTTGSAVTLGDVYLDGALCAGLDAPTTVPTPTPTPSATPTPSTSPTPRPSPTFAPPETTEP